MVKVQFGRRMECPHFHPSPFGPKDTWNSAIKIRTFERQKHSHFSPFPAFTLHLFPTIEIGIIALGRFINSIHAHSIDAQPKLSPHFNKNCISRLCRGLEKKVLSNTEFFSCQKKRIRSKLKNKRYLNKLIKELIKELIRK